MAYDLRSQMYNLNDCIASANSPVARVAAGLTNFTELFQISSSKLVLGGMLLFMNSCYCPQNLFVLVPWYCYDYKCLTLYPNMTCVCMPIDSLIMQIFSF